jgi:tRNA A-37 threonylcarbamoyl transferase component Bud32
MTDKSQNTCSTVVEMPATNRFDFFWQLDAPWFEPPNYCRGGWSGVSQISLRLDNEPIPVFIKRQDRHQTRYWKRGFQRIPTFEREYLGITQLQALGIPTLDPIFFARHKEKAILITKALTNYQSLDKLELQELSFLQKNALISVVAEILAKLHSHHLQHNCLYPKHIFVRPQGDSWEVRLIDLEKLRYKLFKRQAIYRDLSSLTRHLPDSWSLSHRMRFFKAYVNEAHLSPQSKKLWRSIASKTVKKRR